jgi:L-rhamnose mutarotase
MQVESEARWDAIATTDVCHRWWAYMAEFMETKDGKPAATDLREVFFLK